MKRHALLLFAGLTVGLLSGCQTWVREAGLTLPSPYYLKHFPQYFPPSPPYPLSKELASQEEAMKNVLDNQQR